MTIPPTPTPSSTSGCVVIFNQGQPGRTDLFGGTPGGIGVTIPVVSASFATGEELCTLTTLEVARQITKFNTANRIPFAFWGAEELGLVGSTRYVASLGNAQKGAIALNLNFDMVGSPKFVRFVYDGDNSAFPPGSGVQPGPPGSGATEKVFTHYFASQNLPSEPTPFNGRSDYGPFITATPAGRAPMRRAGVAGRASWFSSVQAARQGHERLLRNGDVTRLSPVGRP